MKKRLQMGPYYFDPSYQQVATGVLFSAYKTMTCPKKLGANVILKIFWDRDRGALELAQQEYLRKSAAVPYLMECFQKPYREVATLLKQPLLERSRSGQPLMIPEDTPMQIAVMAYPNHAVPLGGLVRVNDLEVTLMDRLSFLKQFHIILDLIHLLQIAHSGETPIVFGNLTPENLLYRDDPASVLLYDFQFYPAPGTASWETPWTLAYQAGFYQIAAEKNRGVSQKDVLERALQTGVQGTDVYTLLLWVDRYLGTKQAAYRKWTRPLLRWPRAEFMKHMEDISKGKTRGHSLEYARKILQEAGQKLPKLSELKSKLFELNQEPQPMGWVIRKFQMALAKPQPRLWFWRKR